MCQAVFWRLGYVGNKTKEIPALVDLTFSYSFLFTKNAKEGTLEIIYFIDQRIYM